MSSFLLGSRIESVGYFLKTSPWLNTLTLLLHQLQWPPLSRLCPYSKDNVCLGDRFNSIIEAINGTGISYDNNPQFSPLPPPH